MPDQSLDKTVWMLNICLSVAVVAVAELQLQLFVVPVGMAVIRVAGAVAVGRG